MINSVVSNNNQITIPPVKKTTVTTGTTTAAPVINVDSKVNISKTPKSEITNTVNLVDKSDYKKATADFTIRIAHTNDRHSHMDNVDQTSTVIKEIKKQFPDALVLDAGDLLSGTPWYTYFGGEPEMKTIKTMKYDAITIGNHDLDNGIVKFLEAAKYSETPVVVSNLTVDGKDSDKIQPYIIKDVNGKKVAIIGLTVNPGKYGDDMGIKWEDPVKTCARLLPELKQKADAVVLLSHLGDKMDAEIAGEFPQIDVIIGGHSHTSIYSPEKVTHPDMSKNYVTQAGGNGEFVGLVKLTKSNNTVVSANGSLIKITPNIAEDPEIKQLLKPYEDKLNPIINRVVGTTNVSLSRSNNGKGDSAMGNFVTDVIREKAASHLNKPVDIALFNSTGIRSGLPKGDITVGMINEVMPFDNTICVGELSSKQVEDMLAITARYGGSPISGVTYKIENQKSKDIKINGQPIDPDKKYTVATNSFLFEGGSGFTMFKASSDRVDTGLSVRESLSEYFEKHKNLTLPSKVEERTTISPDENWQKTIKDKLGDWSKPAAQTESNE